MCNFGAQAEWRNGKRDFSYYIDVETRNYQYNLVNPTPLDCITGYTMEDAIRYWYLKRLPQQRLNIIDGYISGYCYIINYPERLHMIKQANDLASVLCDI